MNGNSSPLNKEKRKKARHNLSKRLNSITSNQRRNSNNNNNEDENAENSSGKNTPSGFIIPGQTSRRKSKKDSISNLHFNYSKRNSNLPTN
jgi:hypothetical protein